MQVHGWVARAHGGEARLELVLVVDSGQIQHHGVLSHELGAAERKVGNGSQVLLEL
jgi:hypothetical protein